MKRDRKRKIYAGLSFVSIAAIAALDVIIWHHCGAWHSGELLKCL